MAFEIPVFDTEGINRRMKERDATTTAEPYFPKEEWRSMTDYDKKRYKNIMLNHYMFLEMGE